jgi:hypothetical protein
MRAEAEDRPATERSTAFEEQEVAVPGQPQPQPEKSGSSEEQTAGPLEPEIVKEPTPAIAGNPFLGLFDVSRRNDRYALAIVRHSWDRADRLEQETGELKTTVEQLHVALADERIRNARLEEKLSASQVAVSAANVPSVAIGPLIFSAGLYVAQAQTIPGVLVAALGVLVTIFLAVIIRKTMIQLRQIDELEFVGIYDRGVPNKERIVLRPTRRITLAEYVVNLGLKAPGGLVRPLPNNLFWFSDEITIEPPYWIFLYTGPGERLFTTLRSTKEPALVLHWGRPMTILQNPQVEPLVFHLGGILQPSAPSWEELLRDLNILVNEGTGSQVKASNKEQPGLLSDILKALDDKK